MDGPGSWGHFQFLDLFVARVYSHHKLFVYGDEKSSMFIPFILFIGNPYLGTLSPDYFIHPGFFRKYSIKCYTSLPPLRREEPARRGQADGGICQLLPLVLEGALAGPGSRPAPFHCIESAARHGTGMDAFHDRQIQTGFSCILCTARKMKQRKKTHSIHEK